MSYSSTFSAAALSASAQALKLAAGIVALASAPVFSLLPAQASQPMPAAHHATQHTTARASRPADGVALLTNLGTWNRRISTAVPLAQEYFNQGLRLYYAFNHAESVRSFREAQRLDPACVMCIWGEAAALGPNVNAPMDTAAERQAVNAAVRALALLNTSKAQGGANARDAAWVRAVAARYTGTTAATRAGRDSAYADAMAAIADKFPSDVDALAIAAEAAMDLSPWAYWEKDGTPRRGTTRLVNWLERGLSMSKSHPGVCHFYIHAVEAVQPEKAVRCAERLAALMPGAGHIVHMPAHIYIRVGRWADAIAINKHAVHADQKYFDGPHTPDTMFYSAAYQSHNYHFLTLAAVMAGASATAFEASEQVVRIVTPEVARMAPPLQALLAVPVQTLVTFGRWEEVLRKPLPPADLRVALGHFWYARGVAFASTGRNSEARATIDSIRAVSRGLPAGEARMTMDIAAHMVEGEIALQSGNAKQAVEAFTQATALEDGLMYLEPPTWYHPVRHSLGRALLANGQPQLAEQAYLADLRRFPENGWALKGLSQALAAQGLSTAAELVLRRVKKAWKLGDVALTGSRF